MTQSSSNSLDWGTVLVHHLIIVTITQNALVDVGITSILVSVTDIIDMSHTREPCMRTVVL